MRRLQALQARRLVLLSRCDQQRLQIGYRLSQLAPSAQLARLARAAPASAVRYPLFWLVSVTTLILLTRERRLFGWVERMTLGASVLLRAAAIVRLFRQLRGLGGASR